MGGIVPFDFESHAVRSVMIDGKPWFVAADVCRVLEIKNQRDAVAHLDEDEKGVAITDTLGGKQTMNIVSESGLYGLSARSNKPVAKRFWKWVRAELLPALIRDGSYSLQPTADQVQLDGKRAYFAALPEAHKQRAAGRAGLLARIEALVEGGMRVSHAIEALAEETGLSVRTIYDLRRATYMVPEADWQAALAPRWSGPRGMLTECHPEVLTMFLELRRGGMRVSDCHRRVTEAAEANGWHPVPPIWTLRRVTKGLLPAMQRRAA